MIRCKPFLLPWLLLNSTVPIVDANNQPSKQPNIVHIMVDDLGWQDVACYYRDHHDSEPFYETPNMDKLAARGIRFMRAYSPAVTCAPSRAAFMTGQYTLKWPSDFRRLY